ncbi:tRNA pseudouridine(38-40) synthase TruA [candidate division WOR-1 bacterium RIFCSPHIGHO2_01_FULL_53_15]|uniref:tRNA pseudouridine synthase A n=1 Tax=candidate division WOR-1 bacterium RIFCSPHIGHO2_01_FULL_53_15 TaxID=1802564 RepID=A0A1F4Q3V1_UNCSA|nr:MAG: tRNA pseudouridine(38-40) synthase TruA [candidate division WOR-1 bacterium RIFCSPHIGHO2_01_FULL_53_15]OGC12483.1 MAG: tRNA pseudouridine(38-40) synthase TruA [candidate division WOR-1 bacterium RIFCSPHIGHO2_02_FULL_53_26]
MSIGKQGRGFFPNIKLTVSYDGADFAGWELQPGKRTIRGEIEKALQVIYKKKITARAVSRTDAGVHALDNVIFFKPPYKIPRESIVKALNALLPEDLRALKAEEQANDKVKGKTYEYLIFNGPIMPPHLRKIAWHVKPKLNLSAMKKAARYLVGKHDFSSFCAAGGDDNDHVRIIHSLVIGNWSLVIWGKERVIRIRMAGNGFLYKMVRNMVGTLVEVGLGRREPESIKKLILAKDRRQAGKTAPGRGLCLVRINF